MAIPEAHGGAGLGILDLDVLLDEMGRLVLPGPFFSTVLLGGRAARALTARPAAAVVAVECGALQVQRQPRRGRDRKAR